MIGYLIRHGKTRGNEERRYVGRRTDLPLSPAGIEEIARKPAPEVERIYASPMKRCVQTAQIFYPGREIICVPGLEECDFGAFENKNAIELSADPRYQAWIDSGGGWTFPEGEPQEDFRMRCRRAFQCVLDQCLAEHVASAAWVIHGGTIMALMERFDASGGGFYDFQVRNGESYRLDIPEDYAAIGWTHEKPEGQA